VIDRVNGYKPPSDWYLLGALCLVMGFIGFLLALVMNPVPTRIQEIRAEMVRCHLDTQEICSVIVMPNPSHDEVYLLYSHYVK